MPEKDQNQIEIRSEEVQDILGQVPSWIVRWGTVVIFGTVIMILLGSWLFKYPDVKRAQIIVTTENPPASMVAKATGKIQVLFVEDNQYVDYNTNLAIVESAADYEDIFMLKEKIGELRVLLPDFAAREFVSFESNYDLGEIQPAFAKFMKLYQDYQNFLQLDYHNQKIKSLQGEIEKYKLYYKRLQQQSSILQKDLTLAARQFERDSVLYIQNVIPQADYEKSEANKLQKEFAFEESQVNLSTIEIEIAQLNQQILDLELTAIEESKQQQFALLESFENLVAQIALWEQKYLLKTPIAGIVSFTKFWSPNQNVKEGDLVMTVIPSDQGDIIGKISLPIEGSGKVRTGQQVNIKFANYPHMEYGMVKGIIRNISLVPNDNNYAVEVELPEELTTYYGIKIPFNQEMHGQVEIITDNRRLIERIVSPLRSLVSKQKET